MRLGMRRRVGRRVFSLAYLWYCHVSYQRLDPSSSCEFLISFFLLIWN
jgi:hypothetical protein